MIARFYLGFLAVTFLVLAVGLMGWPDSLLSAVEVEFNTPTARADVRADYGGCILGLGAFLAYCTSRGSLVRLGLLCAGLTLFGYASGRVLSLFLDGQPKQIIFTLLAIEVVSGGVALGLAWRRGGVDGAEGG